MTREVLAVADRRLDVCANSEKFRDSEEQTRQISICWSRRFFFRREMLKIKKEYNNFCEKLDVVKL